jgi:hypothetical protein
MYYYSLSRCVSSLISYLCGINGLGDVCHNTLHIVNQHNGTENSDNLHKYNHHNNIQHNDTQRNNTQHNSTQHNDTKRKDTHQNDAQYSATQHNGNDPTQHNG